MTAALWSQWKSDRAAATEHAAHEARILASEVDDHISALQNLLSVLVQAVSYDPADRSANDALLRKVKRELSGFDSHIFLLDTDGNNIGTSASSDNRPPNARDRTYFREAMADHLPAVGDPILVRSGRWVVNVARPVKDETGKIRAVLTVGPVLDHFQDTLRLHGLPANTAISIINTRGYVIAANGGDWIGRRRADWGQLPGRIAAKEGSDTSRWSHRDNLERVNGFALARRVPWMVTVGVPTDIAYGALANRLKWGALMCGGTLAIAFAIAWLLSGRIVRPLRRLGMDAAVLAGGDFSHRTTVRTRDEVGTLASNFNQMAAALERRRQKVRTARGEMRQAKDTLATVIDTSHVAIVCCEPDQSIVLWSRGAERMFGYGGGEALGRQRMLVPPEGMAEAQALFQRAYGGETIRDLHVKRRRKDGALLDVRLAAAPMHNPDGTVRSVAFAYEDITDRKAAEEQLRRLAHYDQLTGLPNRALLQHELGRLLAKDGGKTPTSVVLFDLDEFKDVNDTLGHSTGDQLLIEVGRRLMGVAEERSLVGLASRLGGDEFVVILPNCGDPRCIREIVDLMLKRLNEPFVINDQVVHLGASAGIAIAPQDGADVEELIANADLALYQAKSAGGRNLRFFMPVLRAQAQARRSLGLELRRAFTNNEFEIHFQPQIRLSDNAVVGAEALLRWRHPQRGVLGPGAFIDTLAESAIASGVGRWIIRTACEQSAAWRGMGLPLARMGVNLFPSQAYNEALYQDVMEALRDFALPADALELEITENIALNPEDSAVLQRLHDKGVKLAFDDFGTGYASLSHLTRLPLSRIKIDRSFVGKITHDAHDAAIVRSLIAMAHNLDIGVIAEGVETRQQADFLLNENCEEAQGFLYAKPLPAAKFETYLRTQRLALQFADGLEPSGDDPVPFERRGTKSPGRRRARRA
ncbi:MAG TPA: EAL domain-containing protein [Xanthobacteraceae bacterium]|nr:EAL domain-containing protein [Xanthobacteraceae bacterium]